MERRAKQVIEERLNEMMVMINTFFMQTAGCQEPNAGCQLLAAQQFRALTNLVVLLAKQQCTAQ
jgi:hypothetical protein